MNFKSIALLLVLLASACSIDEFKNKKEKLDCIDTCKDPISACLNEINLSCHKAYISCHEKDNFITCIESSNSLMMQQIAKCMKTKCVREENQPSQ